MKNFITLKEIDSWKISGISRSRVKFKRFKDFKTIGRKKYLNIEKLIESLKKKEFKFDNIQSIPILIQRLEYQNKPKEISLKEIVPNKIENTNSNKVEKNDIKMINNNKSEEKKTKNKEIEKN